MLMIEMVKVKPEEGFNIQYLSITCDDISPKMILDYKGLNEFFLEISNYIIV